MKRSFVFVALLASGLVLSAAAQTSPAPTSAPAGPAKIGVIAFQATVGQTNEGQRDFAGLKNKYEPKQAHLKALSDEIDALTKQLQTQGDSLSDAVRASRAKTLDDKKKQLDRDTQDAQTDFQSDMQQVLGAVAQKVGALMTDYATKHGYTLVLDAGDQQSATVLYAVPSTDITQVIIDAYNEKSGIPAPPAQGDAGGQPAVDAPQPQPAAAH